MGFPVGIAGSRQCLLGGAADARLLGTDQRLCEVGLIFD